MTAAPTAGRWWFALNGFLRLGAVSNAPGFGPPKIVVSEYPRSGGTWIAQMLAAYLGVPFPRHRLPQRRRSIIQGHFLDAADAHDIIVVRRDGRDVMVSYYYFALLELPVTSGRWVRRNRRRTGIEDAHDVHDVHRHLPRFIEYCFESGPVSGMSWKSFAEAWRARTDCVATTYEAMTAEPRRELTKLIRAVTHPEAPAGVRRPAGGCAAAIDDARLDECIARFAFRNVTGRQRGDENPGDLARKGIVGDWKTKFTREAREVFDHYAGRTLIELGYEPDRSWVGGTPTPEADAGVRRLPPSGARAS